MNYKKLLCILSLILLNAPVLTTTTFSNTIYDNGTNIGIGTNNPKQKLHVNDTNGMGSILMTRNGGAPYFTLLDSDGKKVSMQFNKGLLNIQDGTGKPIDKARIAASTIHLDGNVAIGTTQFERAITLKTNKYDGAIHLETTKNNNSFWSGLALKTPNSYAQLQLRQNGNIEFHQDNKMTMALKKNGNVGIGTNSPSRKVELQDSSPIIHLNSNSTQGWPGIEFSAVRNSGESSQKAWNFIYNARDDNLYWYNFNLKKVAMALYDSGSIFLDGNVGIGTKTPTAKFNVKATSYPDKNELLAEFTAGTNSPLAKRYVKLSQTYTGSSWDGIPLVWETNANSSNKKAYGAIQTLANGDIRFLNKPAGSAIAAGSNLNVIEQMRIKTNGNVGIGTKTPTAKFNVKATSYPDKNELLAEFTAGTNSPLAKRYVKLSQTYTGSSWDGIPLVWETNANSSNKKAYGAIQTLANGDIRFLNKPAGSAIAAGSNLNVIEQMRIKTNGNVGIGTNTPTAKLDVNGIIQSGNNSTHGGIFLHQKYGGNDIINSLSSNYSSGSMILGYGVAGMANQGASGHLVSTYDNFKGYRSALRIGQGTLEFLGSNTKLQTPVGNEIQLDSRLFINNTGNVGIGTTSPSSTPLGGKVLHLQNSGGTAAVKIERSDAIIPGTISITAGNYSNGIFSRGNKSLTISTDSIERMRIDPIGNVGIGTNTPTAKLDVNGNVKIGNKNAAQQQLALKGNNSGTNIFAASNWASSLSLTNTNGGENSFSDIHFNDAGGNAVAGIAGIFVNNKTNQGELSFWTRNNSSYNESLRLDKNGNVGIGTKTPQHKLHVNGTVYANEFNSAWESWADKVFEPDYKLLSLENLETFIKENKHLPEIPSEKTIIKKGIGLKALQVKFLTKIEENVLYILQLKAENTSLKSELTTLQKDHQSLQQQLNDIQKRLNKLEN